MVCHLSFPDRCRACVDGALSYIWCLKRLGYETVVLVFTSDMIVVENKIVQFAGKTIRGMVQVST